MNKMTFLGLLLAISFIHCEDPTYSDVWTSFPACRMGRLQSPIRLNVTESTFSNKFSIVYQNFVDSTIKSGKNWLNTDYNIKKHAIYTELENGGGYLHFAKDGVIKQYELKRYEMYQGLHEFGPTASRSKYELHIVFKKNLGFTSNKNQYRRITDVNDYLVIVLRYGAQNGETEISDGGLLKGLNQGGNFNLGNYPVFQDKKAYYYDGAFIYNPCHEDVSYYVVEPIFKLDNGITIGYDTKTENGKKERALAYERPIYRNYMNYTESLSSSFIKPSLLLLVIIALL